MKLPEKLTIPLSNPIKGSIRVPGSKSISNRALLVAALAQGESKLKGLLRSDDTHWMTEALKKLGADLVEKDGALTIKGCGGNFLECTEPIYVENAGTAARFLTAALTLGAGRYVLDGNARMRLRPIDDLIDALVCLGGKVSSIENTGCPPVEVFGSRLKGGRVLIPGDKSSQFISALLLSAAYSQSDTHIQIEGELVSRGYVEMTMQLMEDFGVESGWVDRKNLLVPSKQGYVGREYEIEGDASGASYFLAMAAITRGEILVSGIEKNTTQSDFGLVGILEEMGCETKWESGGLRLRGKPLKAVEVDMNSMSDVAPTLAVTALFAQGKTRIHNVKNMRIKECDRISALVTELSKLGADVTEFDDGLEIEGMGDYHAAEMATYDDHRMAMCLSLAGLKIPGVTILDPSCVSKTFPDFFDYFLPLIQPL